MCGICGFTGKLPDSKEVLTRMMDRIIHRGPDSAGQFITDKAAWGFRRLSIIDLDHGSQPMFNEDNSIVIVFNGEIYNFMTLREELKAKGHVFRNNSDTEVLVHGYEEWGTELPKHCRGMFAFMIYDMNKDLAFGARDYFGIKPFYYGVIDGNLVFGSEIKSILEYPGYVKKVNTEALEQYLTFQYSVLPETFFKGIYKLAPAHSILFKDGEVTIERYWEPDFDIDENADLDELVDKIDAQMQESVQAHMISDVEVGSLLSSGIDSSYIATVSKADKTFTVGFDYDKFNEISYAQDLSEKIGTQNFSKLITEEEYWSVLPEIQYYMDEPLADASCVALYFVDKTAAEHVKVVLSGEGADEFFGGYNIYHEPVSLHGYQKLPKGLRRFVGKAAEMIMPEGMRGRSFLMRGALDVEERFIGNAKRFSVKERKKILKNATPAKAPWKLTKPYYDKVKHLDDTTKMQYIDMNFWLIGDILLKGDKMSMRHSLECRVPFMDREVYKLAKTIPTKYKLAEGTTKYALRKAARRHIPEATAMKKKLGFPVPIGLWLREDKYYEQVKASFESPAAQKFFNTKELVKMLDQHKKGKLDNSKKIWVVYMFLMWYDVYFVQEKVSFN
ncbi:asparagine synthase (glutamine-hydrolyzing) [Frisingicoccus sp.]|uniref:asparagine synthase (glutamine-hydrolyzing) n=2 Tax=Frisingicoccus sp. TaxID=1918627 RepID=UPI002A833530|nr:asparagine synthase (glutamine-hydrolyzing) [Frisingicoccus sp.]MDY4835600.1 asparagine synthase (glutamine-hydrolyzing) [Frisingicoccus sp.]MDY4922240.1 asparagine synthase (glutamine-hydrolyzing) [Frisingicoccus sp.]